MTAFLHERVRADDEIYAAVRDPREDARAVLPGDGRGQERVGHPVRGRVVCRLFHRLEQGTLPIGSRGRGGRAIQLVHRADTFEEGPHRACVLARQDLGGRHDRGLMARLDRDEAGVDRDQGLARSHVALEQHVHRPRGGHRLPDLLDRAELRLRGLERCRGRQAVGQHAVDAVGQPLPLGLQPMLPEGDTQLEREQLVELQPLDGSSQLLCVLGEVHPPEGRVEVLQPLGLDQLGRHGVDDRR